MGSGPLWFGAEVGREAPEAAEGRGVEAGWGGGGGVPLVALTSFLQPGASALWQILSIW